MPGCWGQAWGQSGPNQRRDREAALSQGSGLAEGRQTPGRGPVPPPLAPILDGRGQGAHGALRALLGRRGGPPVLRTFQTHLRPFSSWRSHKFSEPQGHLSPALLSWKMEERKGGCSPDGETGSKLAGLPVWSEHLCSCGMALGPQAAG